MNKELFKENIYKKYEKYKNVNDDAFFNTPIYIKNKSNLYYISQIAAVLLVCLIVTTGIVYAGIEIYKYVTQQSIPYNFYGYLDYNSDVPEYHFYEDMDLKDTVYYKKIYNFSDYQKYKNLWPNLLSMQEKDFEDNFMIVTAITYGNMLGKSIINVYATDSTLYIEFDNVENSENKNSSVIGTKISKDLDRQNIEFKQKIDTLEFENYVKITDIPVNYSIEQALNDNCFVIKENKIISKDKEKLENFVKDTQNGKESFIRIYDMDFDGKITINDILYKDNQYTYYELDVKDEHKKIISDKYARIEMINAKGVGKFFNLYKDNTRESQNIPICVIQ